MSQLRKTVHGRRRISALLFSLLRRLDRWLAGWLQRQRARWARKPAAPGAGLHFELLEPRLLLSADLVGGSLSHDAFTSAVPGDPVSALFAVYRPDSEPLSNPVRIQFYASADSVLDAEDTLVGQTDLAADSLEPGSNAITVSLDTRAIAQPGRYTLIGVVDPDNAIAESDETNNQSLASSPLTLDFAVGQVPGRAPVPALDLTDADGTHLRLTIAGPGIARLTPNGTGYDLSLSGTDAGTRIDLTGSGGDGRITLTGLNADSPFGSLAAPIASLTGVARFATVNTLNLGDIAAGARLEGNSLASLNVSRDALGDLRLTGSGVSGFVLGAAQVGGAIGGLWSITGRANSISGESTRADWRANISSPLTQLVIRGDASGQFAASALQLLQVGGSLKAMSVRIGANLGSDAVLGGSGDAADRFGAGTLARLRVSGDIDDSLIVIGVDPHNGRYHDGDDRQLGTSTNRVQELLVGGRLTGDTQISAPAFPASVRINGVLRSPASLGELASTPPDRRAPTLTAALVNDSGTSASDGLTRDASLSGQASDAAGVTRLLAALDPAGTPSLGDLSDLSSALQPDGRFVLTPALLDTLAGGPLADGTHRVHLVAADAAGNASAPVDLAFTLDTAPPALASFTLDPASDTGTPGDRETSADMVTLLGQGEPGTAVSLTGSGLSTTADASGAFRFADLPLALGDNAFAIVLSDLAGNTTAGALTVTRVNPPVEDHTAPTLAAALLADTGRRADDGITRDATITGTVSDDRGLSGLKRLRAGFGSDPAGFVDILDTLQADGHFTLDAARLAAINGGALPDGRYTLRLVAGDAAGNAGTSSVAFTLDTLAPVAPTFGLSLASDTGSVGDGDTDAARVTLVGSGEAAADLLLITSGSSTAGVVNAGGSFFLPDVDLALGDNAFTLRAIDAAGNVAETNQVIHRGDSTASGDLVLHWNDIALTAIRLDASAPPVATRALAMLSIAVLDTVNAVEGSPGFYVSRRAPAGASLDAAIAAAAQRVLAYLYPGQMASFAAALASALAGIADGAAKSDGSALGRAIADDIIALRKGDGFDDFVDFTGSTAPGQWQASAPIYAVALLPQWADLQPFAMSSPSEFRPPAPPALDSATYTADFAEVKALGSATGNTRSAEQTEIARFWADGAGTDTPPGHWNRIAATLATAQGNSLAANARLFAQLNVALADASIAAWDAKYHYTAWRPITAIRAADTDGNDATAADAAWTSLLITPPFPEYVSGHSTYSGAAEAVLASAFGTSTAFAIDSEGLPGIERSFASVHAAAEEAGRSRIYGGIHFEFANQAGLVAGRALGQKVLETFASHTDTQAPRLLLEQVDGLVSDGNVTLDGRVLDALSCVAVLQGAFDDAAPAAIAFDTDGHFSVTSALALDGSADGGHTLTLSAVDARGNVSAPLSLRFTLDTRAPEIVLSSLAEGDALSTASRLTGTADPTGSTLVSLTYAFDGGRTIPVTFDPASGDFDSVLDLAALAVGAHTLTLTALDAAGHTAVSTLNLTLPELIPLTITRMTPSDGADDVGATFRPQVVFSRPVDVTTLTSSTFYATDTTGAKLAATIVPAADGSFAWLFLTNPLPGASTITLHVVGDGILAGDGQALDADGDGTPGGTFTSRFTTVSVTPIAGTTITGRLLDPGDDLKPMTFDDIRAGADGALHTADDVFLHPIAGAKVFILGLEGHVVYTDANGYFHLDQVPAGDVKLAIDGRTASNAPAGSFYPEMVMDLTIEVGYDNTVMGSMGTREAMAANEERQEVYLPRLQTAILQTVSGTETTEVGVDAVSAPNLTDEQRAHLKLEVQRGMLIGADGKVMSGGQVGISTVPPELVRDMLPPGVLQHTFDITIQAPGVAAFATPLEISFPNVFEAAPGTKLNFLSFDHTTGRLVIEGTATVSADGLSVTTDPGVGITKPGWHGLTSPATTGKKDQTRRSASGGTSAGGGSPSSFDITLDFDTVPKFFAPLPDNDFLALTPAQQAIIEAAARKWESVIVGDVPDTAIVPIAASEESSFFPPNYAVDDIHVLVYQRPMDSIDHQLAAGGPNLLRSNFFGLPYLATLVFDSADIAQLEASGRLYDVALHEIGHALGFTPVVWQYSGYLSKGLPLLTGSGFVGPQAVDQYNAVFGSPILRFGSVPVEDSMGPGTDFGHWKYSVFGNELMVGFLQSSMPLSAITVASFADLNYVVNLGAADPYQKPVSVPPRVLPASPTSVGATPIWSGSMGFHGDFGTETSPVAAGFVPVTDSTLYDPSSGYGWQAAGARIIGAFDAPRAAVTDLTRDIVIVRDATFLADLPNGIYDVSVGLGDPTRRRDQAQVYIEGDLRGNVSTAAGESVVQTYRVSVADNQLTLRFAGNGDVGITSLDVSEVELGDFGGTELRNGKFAFAIQNLDTGFVMRDTRDTTALGGSLCIDGVTLSPGTHYRQWVLDVDSLESGVSDFVTPPAGQEFEMPRIVIRPSAGRDIDGDGLDRVAEFILGTRDDRKRPAPPPVKRLRSGATSWFLRGGRDGQDRGTGSVLATACGRVAGEWRHSEGVL